MAAKCLHTAILGKALDDGARTRSVQDLRHTLCMQISQRHDPLTVQTAGDDGAVAQHADLIPQAIAGVFAAHILGLRVGPFKPLAPFQKYLVLLDGIAIDLTLCILLID